MLNNITKKHLTAYKPLRRSVGKVKKNTTMNMVEILFYFFGCPVFLNQADKDLKPIISFPFIKEA
jgi:hypothetical protein